MEEREKKKKEVHVTMKWIAGVIVKRCGGADICKVKKYFYPAMTNNKRLG